MVNVGKLILWDQQIEQWQKIENANTRAQIRKPFLLEGWASPKPPSLVAKVPNAKREGLTGMTLIPDKSLLSRPLSPSVCSMNSDISAFGFRDAIGICCQLKLVILVVDSVTSFSLISLHTNQGKQRRRRPRRQRPKRKRKLQRPRRQKWKPKNQRKKTRKRQRPRLPRRQKWKPKNQRTKRQRQRRQDELTRCWQHFSAHSVHVSYIYQ